MNGPVFDPVVRKGLFHVRGFGKSFSYRAIGPGEARYKFLKRLHLEGSGAAYFQFLTVTVLERTKRQSDMSRRGR